MPRGQCPVCKVCDGLEEDAFQGQVICTHCGCVVASGLIEDDATRYDGDNATVDVDEVGLADLGNTASSTRSRSDRKLGSVANLLGQLEERSGLPSNVRIMAESLLERYDDMLRMKGKRLPPHRIPLSVAAYLISGARLRQPLQISEVARYECLREVTASQILHARQDLIAAFNLIQDMQHAEATEWEDLSSMILSRMRLQYLRIGEVVAALARKLYSGHAGKMAQQMAVGVGIFLTLQWESIAAMCRINRSQLPTAEVLRKLVEAIREDEATLKKNINASASQKKELLAEAKALLESKKRTRDFA